MGKQLFIILIFTGWLIQSVSAQNHYDRFESIDVQHYAFELHLYDETDQIEGSAKIKIRFLKPASNCQLDLMESVDGTTGMKVNSVVFETKELSFTHKNSQLEIEFPRQIEAGETVNIEIHYLGTPADGLIISENSHGSRTFFGDNWPDRARHWLPTVDHPSDKSTVEFLVYAPVHYEVISNGYLAEKKTLAENIEFNHWKEDVPISTKVMVIGAADFAVGNDTICNGIPVSSWIFKEDTASGFRNYRFGTEALAFFSELIGPYSYEKLAHVQSKTRYGGMENAGCIFYNETSATSKRSQEKLFAHEVAHQWFGNSATEENWHHVWLSEGFATYLTHIYTQHFHGEKEFKQGLILDRERVIAFAHRHPAPVIDTTITDYQRLLNTNTYQKASWFFHMLRCRLGSDLFFEGLRKYYSDFRNSTALTGDFRRTMEKVSGTDLKTFFDQWLRQPGHPVIRWEWEQTNDDLLKIDIRQQQKETFEFPLKIRVFCDDGSAVDFDIKAVDLEQELRLPLKGKVIDVRIDPETELLFEEAE